MKFRFSWPETKSEANKAMLYSAK